jgi:dipeptidyl aminopeptidase/acylaminoacyl peptidase
MGWRLLMGNIGWHPLIGDRIELASFSPDRSRLAYVKNEATSHMDAIYILDLAKQESRKLLEVGNIDRTITMIDWSPDSSALIYLTQGDRKALFLADMTGTSTMLMQAESAEYSCFCLGFGLCGCSGTQIQFGGLEAKWAAKNIVLVQKFTGPMPETIPPYPTTNQTWILHIVDKQVIETDIIPPLRYWDLSSAIPLGDEEAMLYDWNSASWYVAAPSYFEEPDESGLTRLRACTSCLPIAAASPNGLVALSVRRGETDGSVTDVLVTLNLTSNQPEQTFTISSQRLTWAPSGAWLAVLSETSSTESWALSVVDTQAAQAQVLKSMTFGHFTTQNVATTVLAFAWIP